MDSVYTSKNPAAGHVFCTLRPGVFCENVLLYSIEVGMKNNIVEKINRWIDKNKDLFGGKILCSGIDPECARHISRLFPASAVVCLEPSRDEGSGEKTDDRAGEGSLSGPLFLCGDLKSYEGGKFDTVLSLGVAPLRPLQPGDSFPVWKRGTLYLRRASLLMDYYEEEVHSLQKHLRPGGSLLSLVRSEQDEYFLGYCLAAAAEGLAVDTASVRQISCMENGEKQVLQGFTAMEGGRTDISALLAGNLNYSLDRMNTAAEELQGRQAEVMLQADIAELIRGYHLYQGESFKGKLAVYSSAQRQDVIYYFTDVEGDQPYLRRFHEGDRDKVVRHMVGELHRQKAGDKSISWKQLELQDDWSETEL